MCQRDRYLRWVDYMAIYIRMRELKDQYAYAGRHVALFKAPHKGGKYGIATKRVQEGYE
jgi:hypothetical protein